MVLISEQLLHFELLTFERKINLSNLQNNFIELPYEMVKYVKK